VCGVVHVPITNSEHCRPQFHDVSGDAANEVLWKLGRPLGMHGLGRSGSLACLVHEQNTPLPIELPKIHSWPFTRSAPAHLGDSFTGIQSLKVLYCACIMKVLSSGDQVSTPGKDKPLCACMLARPYTVNRVKSKPFSLACNLFI